MYERRTENRNDAESICALVIAFENATVRPSSPFLGVVSLYPPTRPHRVVITIMMMIIIIITLIYNIICIWYIPRGMF